MSSHHRQRTEIQRSSRSRSTALALRVVIALLMIDAAIEFSFISYMVAWLNTSVAPNSFLLSSEGQTYRLRGEPQNFLTDQGHASNGAAGTAFVLVGLGGILSLLLRNRTAFGRRLYYVWLAINIPAFFLTAGALGYVFAVTSAHEGQVIDVATAVALNGASKYPLDSWTPQNWFSALLGLDLVSGADKIEYYLPIIRGWQYNLIPLFVIHLFQTGLAFADFSNWRRESKQVKVYNGF